MDPRSGGTDQRRPLLGAQQAVPLDEANSTGLPVAEAVVIEGAWLTAGIHENMTGSASSWLSSTSSYEARPSFSQAQGKESQDLLDCEHSWIQRVDMPANSFTVYFQRADISIARS